VSVAPQGPPLVSLAAIRRARATIGARLHRTPTATSAYLSERTGARVALKLELFQKTGSFKPRGVLTALDALDTAARERGVISLSAGNHAQALAWGASLLGVRSTVVMPATAAPAKIAATRGYGGEVVQTDGDLLATALQLQRERNLTMIHPFDDLRVIAGQGTVGLEILEDVPDLSVVIVGCGGGGLIAGIAAAVKQLRPTARVIGVEPAGANAMEQSLARGEPVRLGRVDTVADGLGAPFAGAHNLAHVRAYVDAMVTLEDAEIIEGMKTLMQRTKILAEPAGAAATAAVLTGRLAIPPESSVVCVVSGGNVDLARLKEML
jgi:threonine dehydratase